MFEINFSVQLSPKLNNIQNIFMEVSENFGMIIRGPGNILMSKSGK